MKPHELVLRCYAQRKDGYWQAFCLDFNLAVQADSREEVKFKLEQMISEYLYDALAGEDRRHARQLLNRRAPTSLWLKYWFYRFLVGVMHMQRGFYYLFTEVAPLQPKPPCHA